MDVTQIEDAYPLSPVQEGLLSHALHAHGAGVDVEQMVALFAEPIDAVRFREAWTRVIAARAVLRTAFYYDDLDEPLQEIHRDVDIPWVEKDLRALDVAAQEARVEAYLAADRARGFDPTHAPLLRLALFRTAEADYLHVWSFHRIILDCGSVPLVVSDVFAAYDALAAGAEPTLPERRPFADFVRWQRARDPWASEAYWRGVLRGFTAPTPLPGAGDEVPDREEIAHGERAFRLAAVETAALAEIGGSRPITLGTLVQGAWAILLSRFSGEGSVVFGVRCACRQSTPGSEDTDGMIGVLTNTLPVRVEVRPDAHTLAWLHGLQAGGRALREHAHTPVGHVRGFCDLALDAPIFESLVVFDERSLDATLRARGGAWKRRRFEMMRQTGFPLALFAHGGEELEFEIAYDRRRFDEASIDRIVAHLRAQLLAFVGEQPVSASFASRRRASAR